MDTGSDVLAFASPPLRRSVATGLLALVAALFLLTVPFAHSSFWLGLLHASAEAALVGGLADWFAVTALFRRPLGLPIPHTAVVTANKDRIGRGLAAFLADNFLTAENMAGAFRSIDLAARFGAWLVQPDNARMAARWLAKAGADALDRGGVAQLGALGTSLLRSADMRPLLGRALKELSRSGLDSALFDDAVTTAREFLKRKTPHLHERAGRRRPGLLRRSFDREIMRATMQGFESLLDDLSARNSPSRLKILGFVQDRALAALAAPDGEKTLNDALASLVDTPEFESWLRSLLSRSAAPDGLVQEALSGGLMALGGRLVDDPRIRLRFNAMIERAALDALPLREAVVGLVEKVIAGYEAQDFSKRIETVVENDLQFIRINGTLVGAAVGCALFLIRTALQ